MEPPLIPQVVNPSEATDKKEESDAFDTNRTGQRSLCFYLVLFGCYNEL